jgi:hypothetical protein
MEGPTFASRKRGLSSAIPDVHDVGRGSGSTCNLVIRVSPGSMLRSSATALRVRRRPGIITQRHPGQRAAVAPSVLEEATCSASARPLPGAAASRREISPPKSSCGARQARADPPELDVLILVPPALSDEAFVAPPRRGDRRDLVVTEAAVKQHLLRALPEVPDPEGPNRRVRLAYEVVALAWSAPPATGEPRRAPVSGRRAGNPTR